MPKKRFLLKNAPKGREFILKDGPKIKNLLELSKLLHYMSDDVFSHHVTEDRDDFAAWVNDVFKQKKIALDLGKNKSKHGHELILLKHAIDKHFGTKKKTKKKRKS